MSAAAVQQVSAQPGRQRTDPAGVTNELEIEVSVREKTGVADGVVELNFVTVDGSPLPPWRAGAHVDLLIEGVQTRQYSLCGDLDDRSSWKIAVLRNPDGGGSSLYVHDTLAVGDTVRVRGPRNNFPLVSASSYIFIAGGIGITPILPMIAEAEVAGATWRLVYGGRNRASMAYTQALMTHREKVSVWPQDERGLIDLPSILGRPDPNALVYCCGPEPLLDAVTRLCAPWPAHSLHLERFAAKPLTEPALSTEFEVYLSESDITLAVPPDKTILAMVQDAGIDVLSSCREGTCGTCETVVLQGIPDHRDSVLSPDEQAANNCMMICVSRSCTPRLVLDL